MTNTEHNYTKTQISSTINKVCWQRFVLHSFSKLFNRQYINNKIGDEWVGLVQWNGGLGDYKYNWVGKRFYKINRLWGNINIYEINRRKGYMKTIL